MRGAFVESEDAQARSIRLRPKSLLDLGEFDILHDLGV